MRQAIRPAAAIAMALLVLSPGAGRALSTLQPAEAPAPATGLPAGEPAQPGTLVPPGRDVIRDRLGETPAAPAAPGEGAGGGPEAGEDAGQDAGPAPAPGTAPVPLPAPVPNAPGTPDVTGPTGPADDGADVPVLRDIEALPLEVRALRGLLIEAARSGDIERLRPLLSSGGETAQLSLAGDPPDDPIAYLKETGGDPDGRELLAILIDVLESAPVLMDQDTPDAIYVWPYFAGRSLDALTPSEEVELYRIVTAGDVEEMRAYGAYTFYRVGITPQGRLAFFLSGD